jgi:hypothetical protein
MKRVIKSNTIVSELINEIEKNKQTSSIYWIDKKRVQIKFL